MTLAAPLFAVLLLAVPGLALLYAWGFRRRRRALAAFVDPGLAPRLTEAVDWRRRALKAALLVAACGFLAIALMQPQWGRESGDAARRGRDIYILLDVSRSMLAEDAAPSRLEAAKEGIRALVEKLRGVGGHRLGLVVFAGRAMLQSPLTLDYGFFLSRLEPVSPAMMDRQGSALGDAIRKTLFGFGAIDPTYTDIVVITDGEDHNSGPLAAARDAADEGVAVYTVGVGDPVEGARIPIEVGDGARQFLRFEGREVVTVMGEPALREIARVGGGHYIQARTGAVDLGPLFDEDIADKVQRELDIGEGERLADRYGWFALIALILLAAEIALPERRREGEATT